MPRSKEPNQIAYQDALVTRIVLCDGAEGIIDTLDYPVVQPYRWLLHSKRYMSTHIKVDGAWKTVFLQHRLVAAYAAAQELPYGASLELDGFVDGNGLDCRRDNLIIKAKPTPDYGSTTERFIHFYLGRFRLRIPLSRNTEKISIHATLAEAIATRDAILAARPKLLGNSILQTLEANCTGKLQKAAQS